MTELEQIKARLQATPPDDIAEAGPWSTFARQAQQDVAWLVDLVESLHQASDDLEETVEVVSNSFLILEGHIIRWAKVGPNYGPEVSMSGRCNFCGMRSPCPADVWQDLKDWRKYVPQLSERKDTDNNASDR